MCSSVLLGLVIGVNTVVEVCVCVCTCDDVTLPLKPSSQYTNRLTVETVTSCECEQSKQTTLKTQNGKSFFVVFHTCIRPRCHISSGGGFWRANVYFTLRESSNPACHLKMNKVTIYKEFCKTTEAIKTAVEETKNTLRMLKKIK